MNRTINATQEQVREAVVLLRADGLVYNDIGKLFGKTGAWANLVHHQKGSYDPKRIRKLKNLLPGIGRMRKSSGKPKRLNPNKAGYKAEEIFRFECEEKGWKVKDTRLIEPHDFFVNGIRVEVKSSSISSLTGLWQFGPIRNQDFDVLVCVGEDGERLRWFFYPRVFLDGLTGIAMTPHSDQKGSKYKAWEDRWDLLKKKG